MGAMGRDRQQRAHTAEVAAESRAEQDHEWAQQKQPIRKTLSGRRARGGSLPAGSRAPPSPRLTDEVAHLGVAVLLGHLVQRAQLLEIELLQGQGQLKCIQGVACG
jgi:hypothetical protein